MARHTAGRLAALCACLGLLGAACSGDDGGTTTTAATAPAGTSTAEPSTAGPSTDGPSTPGGTTAPQRLTLEQAQLLATMRVANYRATQGSFVTSVTDQGDVVGLHGVVDWQQHIGSAVFRTAGRTDANASGLMQWNFEKVAAHPGGDVDGPPPAPEADGTWIQRSIDPTRSSLDALFLVLLSVASPDPDNPQLLQQTDAAYLGTEIVSGETATVFTGPTSDDAADPTATTVADASTPGASAALTYWVAADGRLLRLRAVLGNQTVTVDFSAPPSTPTLFLPDLVETTAPTGS